MYATRAVRICSLLALMMLVGCASEDKQRISLLEQTNAQLTSRLNAANADMQKLRQDQEYLDSRLHSAMNEAQDCREQLANQPEPQETPPGWTAIPGGAMIAIEGDILFAPGQATLQSEARQTLDAIINVVQGEYQDHDVLILGHTDDQPIRKSGWKDNAQLSAERALAVMRYLQERGVNPARMMAAGCGEHRPRQSGTSATARAANRRVEFYALQPLAESTAP